MKLVYFSDIHWRMSLDLWNMAGKIVNAVVCGKSMAMNVRQENCLSDSKNVLRCIAMFLQKEEISRR